MKPKENETMSKAITKAEQRILNLIAERPGISFMAFNWLGVGCTAERRATHTKESHPGGGTSPQYIMIGDDDQGYWEGRTTLGVMIRLAERGAVQSFDEVEADSYFMKTVRPVASSEVA